MRRTALTVLAVAVVFVVLAELGVRAASARLPEPSTFYHPVAQVKVEQMDALAASGTHVDVVLAGTSQMAIAGDPTRFRDDRDGHPLTYNAAILAGYPSANHRYLLEEIVPRLRPRTVVYGVSAEDLQPGEEAPYDQARATATGVLGDLDRWAAAHSALVEHRRDLRDPSTWAYAASGGAGGGSVAFYRDDVVGQLGSWRAYADHGCQPAVPGRDGAAPPSPPPASDVRFSADDARIEAIWSTVDAMRAQGIEVVMAVMPFADCYFARSNAQESDAEGRRRIIEGAAARGLVSVDVSADLHDDAYFGDPGHVNAEGAKRYTHLLAQALNEAV